VASLWVMSRLNGLRPDLSRGVDGVVDLLDISKSRDVLRGGVATIACPQVDIA